MNTRILGMALVMVAVLQLSGCASTKGGAPVMSQEGKLVDAGVELASDGYPTYWGEPTMGMGIWSGNRVYEHNVAMLGFVQKVYDGLSVRNSEIFKVLAKDRSSEKLDGNVVQVSMYATGLVADMVSFDAYIVNPVIQGKVGVGDVVVWLPAKSLLSKVRDQNKDGTNLNTIARVVQLLEKYKDGAMECKIRTTLYTSQIPNHDVCLPRVDKSNARKWAIYCAEQSAKAE